MNNNSTANPTTSLLSFSVKDMALCGMFAALMAVVSQLSIPMPTGVPITIQFFAVALTGAVLGSRLGFFAALAYIFIGAVGLPVFANFRGGLNILFGVTGGYLWCYPAMAALCGIAPGNDSRPAPGSGFRIRTMAIRLLFAFLGFALTEIAGGLQWAMLAGDMTVGAVFTYAIVAFIPKDLIITAAAILIGSNIRTAIKRSGY